MDISSSGNKVEHEVEQWLFLDSSILHISRSQKFHFTLFVYRVLIYIFSHTIKLNDSTIFWVNKYLSSRLLLLLIFSLSFSVEIVYGLLLTCDKKLRQKYTININVHESYQPYLFYFLHSVWIFALRNIAYAVHRILVIYKSKI